MLNVDLVKLAFPQSQVFDCGEGVVRILIKRQSRWDMYDVVVFRRAFREWTHHQPEEVVLSEDKDFWLVQVTI